MIAVRAIVTDIEGTTSTIAFVHTVLFPYADAHLDDFVRAHRADPIVAQALQDVALAIGEPNADDARVLAELHTWIAEDRKATPLKTLQGLIWEEGYARDGLRSHVYDDVPPALRAWHDAGIALFIYSSGSIAAQRLLMANSIHGDLTPFFRGYFDTTIGGKRERASYGAIARELELEPNEILFLSDVDAELDAARATGMQTARLMRPADTLANTTSAHPTHTDFTTLARIAR